MLLRWSQSVSDKEIRKQLTSLVIAEDDIIEIPSAKVSGNKRSIYKCILDARCWFVTLKWHKQIYNIAVKTKIKGWDLQEMILRLISFERRGWKVTSSTVMSFWGMWVFHCNVQHTSPLIHFMGKILFFLLQSCGCWPRCDSFKNELQSQQWNWIAVNDWAFL